MDAIFGSSIDKDNIKRMLEKGALIIDVRTYGEYQSGHVEGSKNIPIQIVHLELDNIKDLNKPLVLCCATGNRSGQVAKFLKKHGLECENGGGWKQVNNMAI